MAVSAGTCIICGIPAVSAADNLCQYCLRMATLFEVQAAFQGIATSQASPTVGLAVGTMLATSAACLAQAIVLAPNAPVP